MPVRNLCLAALLAVVFAVPTSVSAEPFTVATWNIENFRTHFRGYHLNKKYIEAGEELPDDLHDLIRDERNQNREDLWQVAETFKHEDFSPDVLVIQEGCQQSDLEYFNREWLDEMYETVIVFETNSGRGQTLALMMKPGFKVIERKDQYFKELDTGTNPYGPRLFARGPFFVLVESPTGYQFWVGNTHQKSKGGNSVEVTAWRNREATRTREIITEIRDESDVDDILFLGDFNDAMGIQEYEDEGGGDTVANNVGGPEDRLVLVTEELAEAGEITFGGYNRDRFRSFIDHIVATEEMMPRLSDPRVFDDEPSRFASDHYPVLVTVDPNPDDEE